MPDGFDARAEGGLGDPRDGLVVRDVLEHDVHPIGHGAGGVRHLAPTVDELAHALQPRAQIVHEAHQVVPPAPSRLAFFFFR